MREILFRGIPYDWNQFIYGYYYKNKDSHYISTEMYEKASHIGIMTQVQVHPETVGEYTGLLDMHGKKVFEGDVCEITNTWNTFKREVIFKDAGFGFQGTTGMFIPNQDLMEVIGNIHESPELIVMIKEKQNVR